MLKIYSWNVNGIRAVIKKGTFQAFVAEHRPDILCMQETKAERGQAEIDLPDYAEFWNSAEKKGYSGTAIFTRRPPLNVECDFADGIGEKYALDGDGYGDPAREGRVITAEYDDFYLVTVYTPNSKRDLTRLELRHQRWDPAFLEHCRTLEARKPVVFCGDLNVAHTEDDLANPKSNVGKHGFTREERDGFQAFLDAGYVDSFRRFYQGNGYYTWWTHWAKARERNVGWRIDYFLVSSGLQDRLRSAAIHPEVMGSDHCPVSIELDL